MEDDIKALHEEIVKLRERVALLESRPLAAPSIQWVPQPWSDQHAPRWVNPAPFASPCIPNPHTITG